MYNDTTVVIPTLNEAKNIPKLLDRLISLYPGVSVVVADDCSKDGTQDIVKKYAKRNKRIKLIIRSGKVKGLTASVLDGVKASRTKFVVVMDADLQHPPQVVKSIVESLRKGNSVVVGTRTSKPSEWALHRALMSNVAVWMGRLRLKLGGAYARDVVSGLFGADAALFKRQISSFSGSFVPEGYKVCLDLLKTLPRETSVAEAHYSFALRKSGTSKIGKRQVIAYFKSLLR